MRNGLCILLLILLFQVNCIGQETWYSNNYEYSIEIPHGFDISPSFGENVDLKAANNENSIVVVVKKLPMEYSEYNIWEIMGDLSTYEEEWEYGAREYMNKPDFLKHGKTELDGIESFWYDYTTDNPKLYSKTYQLLNDNFIYTITLTCLDENYNEFSPIWYRVKTALNFYKINLQKRFTLPPFNFA